MPPKKKGAVIIDGVDTTPMTREQLEKFALNLREEVFREREERNRFQTERDKIATFWDIAKEEITKLRAELRLKDRELEEKLESHQKEMILMKQRVKHLDYEFQNDLGKYKADTMLSLKLAEDDFHEQEMILLTDKKDYKAQMIEKLNAQQEESKELELKHSEEISNIRSDFEFKIRLTEDRYKERMEELRTELMLLHNMELTEVKERKNKQVADLITNHEEAFAKMKNYYNDITLNNLALIDSLKAQMEDLKLKAKASELVADLQFENQKLKDENKAIKKELENLRMLIRNLEKERKSFRNAKKMIEELRQELNMVKMENEVMEERLALMKQEQLEVKKNFVRAVNEVQRHASLACVLLEKKLRAMSELLSETELHFAMVFKKSGLVSSVFLELRHQVTEFIRKKNVAIQDLEYELARVCKAHDDLLQTYESKLLQYGIPKEELGFQPLRGCVPKGKGPAGLVTINR